MKSKFLAGVAAIALTPASAMAIGLDRSGQDVGILFEEGNYFEFSFGRVFPDISGEDSALNPIGPLGFPGNPGGQESGDIADDYNQVGAALKLQFTDAFSMAFIAAEPFGADVGYDAGGSVNLGGTSAMLESSELMALGRYQINDSFSVHGGLRYVRLGEAEINLSGLAYAPIGLSGYNVQLDEDSDIGFAVGAAYERPEIALRVALTYFSKTEHDQDTTESIPQVGIFGFDSTTTVETPESINLDFQTGINQRTLAFGQIRYAWYEDVVLTPQAFGALTASLPGADGPTSLTTIEDNYSISLGVGRRLTDKLSGSLTLGYEAEGDEFGSPLAPTNGQKSIGLGLSYDINDQVSIAGGVRYVKLGDGRPSSGICDAAPFSTDGSCADFEDNDAFGVGMQIGYSF